MQFLRAVAVVLLLGCWSGAAAQIYSEDFTSATYWDQGTTTAQWDTLAGQVRLPLAANTISQFDTSFGVFYVFDLDVSGNYAFCAADNEGLVVVDIRDKSQPKFVIQFDLLEQARDIRALGNVLYLANNYNGLYTFDITDPEQPQLLDEFRTVGQSVGMCVEGNTTYFADGPFGLTILDTTDPSNLDTCATWNSPGYALAIDVVRPYAYLADGAAGLQVVDVSDPYRPTFVGNYNTPGLARGVVVDGDVAYVSDTAGGIQVVSVANKVSPDTLATISTPAICTSAGLYGDILLATVFFHGLYAYDVSDPSQPVLLGVHQLPGDGHHQKVVIEGDYAYVCSGADGFFIVDLTVDIPAIARGNVVGGPVRELVSFGEFLYAGESGLVALDASDPANPMGVLPDGDTVVNSLVVWSGVNAVHGASNPSISPDGHGLVTSDITTAPTIAAIDTIGVPAPVFDLELFGEYLYSVTNNGITTYKVSPPTAFPPITTGQATIVGSSRAMALAGDCAYLANDTLGLIALDMSLPNVPTMAGMLGVGLSLHDVVVDGDIAYALSDSALEVIDVVAPASPTLVATLPLPGVPNRALRFGDRLYVAAGSAGVCEVDVSTQTSPFLVRTIATGSSALVAKRRGQYLYVGVDAGVEVFEMTSFFDAAANIVQSLDVYDDFPAITSVQLNGVGHPMVAWEVTVDGGANWFAITPDDTWTQPVFPGVDLRWRATLPGAASAPATISSVTINVMTRPTATDVVASDAVRGNYPNPFNPSTTIEYSVARNHTRVTMTIYDVAGRRIATLIDGTRDAGNHSIRWDGTNHRGTRVASGVYFLRSQVGTHRSIRKLVLVQ